MSKPTKDEEVLLKSLAMNPGWTILERTIDELVVTAMRRNPAIWNVLKVAYTQGEIRGLVMVRDLIAGLSNSTNVEE